MQITQHIARIKLSLETLLLAIWWGMLLEQ